MKRLILTMITAAVAYAQNPPDNFKVIERIIEVKYGDVNRIASILTTFTGNIRSDERLHVITVKGNAETIANVEAAVKKLDVPPLNIELIVYLVSGSNQNASDSLPSDLTATAKQLHGIFSYKGYRIIESFVLRSRDGREAKTSGDLPGTSGSNYDFHYRSANVSSGTPRIVHFDNLSLSINAPNIETSKGNTITRSTGLSTDIDVAEGQKVVVGKSSFNGSSDALILVVTAKIIE